MSGDSESVIAANDAFYRAFAAHDLAAMAAAWSSAENIACVHPGWDVIGGREAVLSSWRDILSSPAAPMIEWENEQAFVVGDVALVVCHELVEGARLVATNTFVREAGGWKIIHHQASPLAAAAADPSETPPPRSVH